MSISARVQDCRDRVQAGLSALRTDGPDATLVHDVRVGLRRLQAYAELMDEPALAETFADSASKLSRLRMLQVFVQYLADKKGPAKDLKKVRKRVAKAWKRLKRKDALSKIDERVAGASLPISPPDSSASLHEPGVGIAAHDSLMAQLARAEARPRRKRLHALRLRIKAVRYQEEWLAADPAKPSPTLAALKRAQTVLGRYEERAAFRRLGRRLDLTSVPRIVKDWKRARRRARKVPGELRLALQRDAGRHADRRVVQLHRA